MRGIMLFNPCTFFTELFEDFSFSLSFNVLFFFFLFFFFFALLNLIPVSSESHFFHHNLLIYFFPLYFCRLFCFCLFNATYPGMLFLS